MNDYALYLVLLEFVDEAKIFLSKFSSEIKSNPKKFVIVTFNPLVKYFLLKKNIPSIQSFRFCPTLSHQKLLLVLEEFTDLIRKQIKLRDSIGIEVSYREDLIFFLRIILSHWLYRVEVVWNAVEEIKPKKIISIGSEDPEIVQSFFVEPEERYISNIACQISLESNIEWVVLRRKKESKSKRKIAFWLKENKQRFIVAIAPMLFSSKKKLILVSSLEFGMVNVLQELKNELGSDYSFGIIDFNYKIKNLFIALYQKLFDIRDIPYEFIPCSTNNIESEENFTEQSQKLRRDMYKVIENINYRNVKAESWLKKKYHLALEPKIIGGIRNLSINLDCFFRKWRPVFIIAQYSRISHAVLGELCRLKNIPSFMIPHGTFTPTHDDFSIKEWRENALGMLNTPFQYVALQTPLVEGFLKQIPCSSKPIKTGPLVFGRRIELTEKTNQLKKIYENRGKIILHAGTPKARRGTRFINYETVDEYIDGLISLVNVVSNLEGIYLIIRYRPIENITPKDLKTMLPNSKSFSIATDGLFGDYLSLADLLVSFSSTTIEEALQNNIPVLLFNKYKRYQHIKGSLLTQTAKKIPLSAVYNINCQNDLDFGVKWILSNHLLKDQDTEYLFKKYKYSKSEIVKLSSLIKKMI